MGAACSEHPISGGGATSSPHTPLKPNTEHELTQILEAKLGELEREDPERYYSVGYHIANLKIPGKGFPYRLKIGVLKQIFSLMARLHGKKVNTLEAAKDAQEWLKSVPGFES